MHRKKPCFTGVNALKAIAKDYPGGSGRAGFRTLPAWQPNRTAVVQGDARVVSDLEDMQVKRRRRHASAGQGKAPASTGIRGTRGYLAQRGSKQSQTRVLSELWA
jgi:hypothetical protein